MHQDQAEASEWNHFVNCVFTECTLTKHSIRKPFPGIIRSRNT